jgi:hypothetical protein
MTLRENLSFTRSCIGEALFAGTVELHAKASRVLTPPAEQSRISKAKRPVAVSLGLLALPLTSVALAAAPIVANVCGQTNSGGTNGIVDLFKTVGTIIIAIGGAAFLVTLGIGALMIMASGGNSQRADKGMGWIKNSIIGVGLLAFGVFIRSIVVHIVSNMTTAVSSGGNGISNNDNPNGNFNAASCLDNSKFGDSK